MELLLGFGADVRLRDSTGQTPVDKAMLHGQQRVARRLQQVEESVRDTRESCGLHLRARR